MYHTCCLTVKGAALLLLFLFFPSPFIFESLLLFALANFLSEEFMLSYLELSSLSSLSETRSLVMHDLYF